MICRLPTIPTPQTPPSYATSMPSTYIAPSAFTTASNIPRKQISKTPASHVSNNYYNTIPTWSQHTCGFGSFGLLVFCFWFLVCVFGPKFFFLDPSSPPPVPTLKPPLSKQRVYQTFRMNALRAQACRYVARPSVRLTPHSG